MNNQNNLEKSHNQGQKENEVYQGVGSFIFEVIKIVFIAFLIFAPIRFLVFQPFFVQGASMEPNFENSEYLIINELGYKEISLGEDGKFFQVGPFRELERGWPVVFQYPKNNNQYFIKRIIGLPGEKVEVRDGQVAIYNTENPEGFVLDESDYLEPYIQTTGDLIIQLEDDEYFVMGDNRMFSSDSRSWGPVKKSDIVGKVLIRAWPLSRMTVF